MVARISLVVASMYTLALTGLSLVQLGEISLGDFKPTDKMMHAGAYLVLVCVWKLYFVLKEHPPVSYKFNLFKIAGLAIVFGMLIEVLQGAVTSYRQPDWLDVLANSTGVILAIFILLAFQGFLERLKSKINLIF